MGPSRTILFQKVHYHAGFTVNLFEFPLTHLEVTSLRLEVAEATLLIKRENWKDVWKSSNKSLSLTKPHQAAKIAKIAKCLLSWIILTDFLQVETSIVRGCWTLPLASAGKYVEPPLTGWMIRLQSDIADICWPSEVTLGHVQVPQGP